MIDVTVYRWILCNYIASHASLHTRLLFIHVYKRNRDKFCWKKISELSNWINLVQLRIERVISQVNPAWSECSLPLHLLISRLKTFKWEKIAPILLPALIFRQNEFQNWFFFLAINVHCSLKLFRENSLSYWSAVAEERFFPDIIIIVASF